MNPFQSLREYELYIYTLLQHFPQVDRSTLVVAQRGRLYAEVTGELAFSGGHRLIVYERLTWDRGPLVIEGYSYEVWRGGDKLYWYDSQPHPHDPDLASTDPHHKHVPPDIKHHRIPAPGLCLDEPNLSFLIHEVEATLLREQP
jgi:hypothetical protein